MKRSLSKLFLIVLLLALTCGTAFAAGAKVTYVKGKVEVNRANSWVALKVGDVINESETISTGFQSEARLNYNGSVMAVPALSRVTLETLQSSDTKDTVSLKVDTGAVRSKVTHTEGKRIEYSARTSVAVASVRGTDFAVFASGQAKVFEGAIAYYKASDFVPPAANQDTEDEGEDEDDSEGSADEGPATASTPAQDIKDDAPKGSTVVGAGQTSTIGKNGAASNPLVEAKNRTSKAKTVVASESAKEAAAAAATAATTAVETPATNPVKPSFTKPDDTKTKTSVNVKVKVIEKEDSDSIPDGSAEDLGD